MQTEKNNYIKDAWLVILLAIIYGAGLAGVQMTLGPSIIANIKNETNGQIPSLVPGANQAKTKEINITLENGKSAVVYHAFDQDGNPLGWVLPGSGQGFADKILLLVGIDNTFTSITGLYVLDQKETPGLGNYIADKPFQNQFIGLDANAPVEVTKGTPSGKSQIKALTGATISSRSVAKIVNETIAKYKAPLLNL